MSKSTIFSEACNKVVGFEQMGGHIEACEDCGTDMGIMCKSQTAAFTTMTAMGYSDFLMNTLADPDFVMDFIKTIQDYCMKELEVFLEYPVDIVQFSSGLFTNTAPMVDYEALEELELKFIEEGMKLAGSKGKKQVKADLRSLFTREEQMYATSRNWQLMPKKVVPERWL